MKIAVGLSGGVDSSVVALMLKEAGHDVVGITMRLWREGRYRGGDRAACFGPNEEKSIALAAEFADSIGIGHMVFDCSEDYDREIIRYFREASLQGLTPNPCVVCNALFPLGGMTKAEVRAFAAEKGLSTADRLDSQDFYSGDRNELIGETDREGDIVDLSGKVLGRHSGFWRYTVGQRKGIGVYGPEPHYVIRLDSCRNQVVVGSRQEAFRTEFRVEDMKWMASGPTDRAIPCRVKIRSTGSPIGPVVFENGVCHADGDGLFGVAPGQSAVFYDDSGRIVCGGVIA